MIATPGVTFSTDHVISDDVMAIFVLYNINTSFHVKLLCMSMTYRFLSPFIHQNLINSCMLDIIVSLSIITSFQTLINNSCMSIIITIISHCIN
jgi:hypothetical protein